MSMHRRLFDDRHPKSSQGHTQKVWSVRFVDASQPTSSKVFLKGDWGKLFIHKWPGPHPKGMVRALRGRISTNLLLKFF